MTIPEQKILFRGVYQNIDVSGINDFSGFQIITNERDTLEKSGNYFLGQFDNLHQDSLTLNLVKGNEICCSETYSLQKLEDPKCYLGEIRDSNVSVEQLLQNPGLHISYAPQPYPSKISIASFKGMIIKKNGKKIALENTKKMERQEIKRLRWSEAELEKWYDLEYEKNPCRSCFSSEQLQLIRKMKSGDVLRIESVIAYSPDSCSIQKFVNLKFKVI